MMPRKLWTRFCLLANYRKLLILVGLTILSDILYETATGGLPNNSDEAITAVTYFFDGIIAFYTGVKR